MYHWEADQEDFLVLAGEALLIVEGEERPLRQWDLVHCPAGDEAHHRRSRRRALPGARSRRPRPLDRPGLGRLHRGRGRAAPRRGVEQETTDRKQAYARFTKREPTGIARAGFPR